MEKIYIDEIDTIDRLITRSKDTNIIYLTEDTILNTKAVQKIANRLEQLEKENKELERKYIWRKSMYDRFVKENKEYKDYIEKLDKLNAKDFIFKHELEDYIPKSVIRDKIEELEVIVNKYNKQMENDEDTDLSYEEVRNYDCKLETLKEILGDE